MEELLASHPQKITKLSRGQLIEGEIMAMNDRELTLDLGAKSEGILSVRDLGTAILKDLKIGDKIKAYVIMPENEHGQIILSSSQYKEKDDRGKKPGRSYSSGSHGINWPKFSTAQSQKTKLQGLIKEVNTGGLIVEVDGSRGFIPHSQLGLELLGKEMDSLIGQQITVSVIEVDQNNNKLVFSQKEGQSEAFDKAIEKYKPDEVVKGEVINISEAGVTVKLEGEVEGFLKSARTESDSKYEVGKSVSFLVDSVDTTRKRINLAPFVTSTTGLIYK